MKDFDQFFKDRLEGERPHPRRDENWRQLSRRLEAFESGIQRKPGSPRRWTKLVWQFAAGVAAAGTIWVASQNHTLRLENQALREQLAQSSPVLSSRPDITTTAPFEGAVSSGTLPHNAPPASSVQAGSSDSDHQIFAESKPAERQSADRQQADERPLAARRQANEAGSNRKTAGSNHKKQPIRPAAIDPAARPTAPNSQSNVADDIKNPATDQQTILEEALPKAGSDCILTPPVTVSLLPTGMPDSVHSQTDQKPRHLPVLETNANSALPQAAAPQMIKPARQPMRYRVGIQALAGASSPEEDGVSYLLGQSFSAEARLWKDVWLGASVDLMHYEVDTKDLPARFGLPREAEPYPPGGPVPHDPSRLVRVESEMKQRRFSAQLSYSIPFQGRVRPYVQTGYVWTQQPSSMVLYEFKIEQHHGGGQGHDPFEVSKFYSRRTTQRWEKNTWRLGAGVEFDAGRWAFGLSASYDKNFTSNDPLFDALLLKGGASYQF